MIVRIFDTAAAPENIERGKELFRTKVRPAFASLPGCHGIEMLIGVDEHSGDLVELTAISRWDSLEAIAAATKTPEYDAALEEIRQLFAQAPIVRHFESIE
ncbi:MAG TPA: antibiotic biosynthesis monooxygenase [Actinomycetota bacterium]|nr:antibiotic biosynthesis monooxygenase [Actinomycetota bacterium]